MANSTANTGVWDVRRTLRLDGDISDERGVAVVERLKSLEGVHNASFSQEQHRLTISYSAAVLDYATVVSLLHDSGVKPASSWWQRLKGRWYQFTDSNARENANLPPPACCNKPPKKP